MSKKHSSRRSVLKFGAGATILGASSIAAKAAEVDLEEDTRNFESKGQRGIIAPRLDGVDRLARYNQASPQEPIATIYALIVSA